MNKNLLKQFYILPFLLVTAALHAQTWQPLGPDDNNHEAGFSAGACGNTSLALMGTTPYAAYADGINGYKTTVMKFEGSNWVPVGTPGFSAGNAGYISMACNGSTPYVFYQDKNGKATVMKYDGSNWVPVGTPGFSAGTISFISIAFNGNIPYVAYKDITNNKATVMKFDGSNWVPVGIAGASPGYAVCISLAFSDSIPYVAYQDGVNGSKATVMKFDGSNWVPVGTPGFSTGYVGATSLVINGTTPYLAYLDYINSNKATVMKFDGSNWLPVGNVGFSAGRVDYLSLAFNGNTPYLAYQDGGNSNKVTAMQFDGTNWITTGSAGFSATTASYISMAVSNNNIYVLYSSGGAFAKVYKSGNTLPINFTSIKGYEKNQGIQVDWNVATESNILHYEIEKSLNGNDFTKINEVAARANNNNAQSYNSFDKNPVKGNNFYRIKAVENSGKINYSQIVNVKLTSSKGNIVAFPNPVSGNTINLRFDNKPAGRYEVNLVNNLSQQFLHTIIQHPGGSTIQTIELTASVGKGVYQLQVRNGDNVITQKIMLE
ncbi:MAG: C-terminal target protein [Segetibacter sp.]|nr:C-terminal target protein [Segetibacter sp.]